MNLNIFIAHSNKFMQHTSWFADYLRSRGLNPIVMEFTPNYGRSWSVPEKYRYLTSLCDTALIIATPDETQDGIPIPRYDVTYEIGNLSSEKNVIFLKERTTKLPTGLSPVYVPFELENPQYCLDQLDRELVSIFGDSIDTIERFSKPPPKIRKEPVYSIEGKGLAPENPIKIQREIKTIFLTKSKREQKDIVQDIITLLDEPDEDKRWISGLLIQEILEYDSSLIPIEVIIKMSKDSFFSVRMSAAVSLYALANISPGKVPLDIVKKLTSTHEDWYVFTPAIATLQTLSHIMPRALDFLFDMASSDDSDEAEWALPKLLEVVQNDPEILSGDQLHILLKHHNRMVQEYGEKIKNVIKEKGIKTHIIRYSPF